MSGNDQDRVLRAFSKPKSLRQVQRELKLKKLNISSFLDKEQIILLNPQAPDKQHLYLSSVEYENGKDWDLIG